MSENSHKKYQHERLVIFLDDAFCDSESAKALRDAGYIVEEMTTHFPQSENLAGKREQGVKDPRVITLCNRKKWLIVTKDKNMRITHVEQIKKTSDTMILATARNPCCDVEIWINAIVSLKPAIERKFKRQVRPWYAQFTRDGKITVCETIIHQTTRRNRAREMEAV